MNFLASRFARKLSFNPLSSLVFRSYSVNAGSLNWKQAESQILDFQNGVVFFKTPNDVPLTYKSLIKLEDGSQALVVSLSDQTTAALLLNDKKFEAGEFLRFSFTGQQGVYTNVDTLNFGKIVNYLGKPINDITKEDQGGKMNIYSNLSKSPNRKKIDTQLFTGNIAVDFTKPLAKGNFILFQGGVNTGKTHLAAQTAINFIKNSVFDKSERPKKVIYCNVNINETNTLFKDLQDADCLDDVIGFSASSKQPSGYYFAPFTALTYANYLKSQGIDVLLIFDDLVEHFTKESLIFNTVSQPFGPLNVVNELYAATGMFEKGSLTTIMVYDNNQSQPQLQASLNTYSTHLESLCDVKIDFDFADPMYKSVLPKIDTTVSRSTYYWMPKIMQIYSRGLSNLLNELKEEKDTMSKKKELNIQVDPWECYLSLDSNYFMKLLISSRKQNIIEELILVGFVIRALENDAISYFKDDPKVLTEELFKFAKELKEFEKTDIITYIARLAERDIDVPENSQAVVDSINRLYELFFMHCRIQNRLLPYKKDYFN